MVKAMIGLPKMRRKTRCVTPYTGSHWLWLISWKSMNWLGPSWLRTTVSKFSWLPPPSCCMAPGYCSTAAVPMSWRSRVSTSSNERGVVMRIRWPSNVVAVARASVMLGTLLFIVADDSEHLPAGSSEVDEGGGRVNDALCPERPGFDFHGVLIGDGQLEPGSSLGGLVGERVVSELDAEARSVGEGDRVHGLFGGHVGDGYLARGEPEHFGEEPEQPLLFRYSCVEVGGVHQCNVGVGGGHAGWLLRSDDRRGQAATASVGSGRA